MDQPTLELNGFSFPELLTAAGLERLDRAFLEALRSHDPALAQALSSYRDQPMPAVSPETSALLIACASFLEDYVARLFGIEPGVALARAVTRSHDVVMQFKKHYVLRRARRYAGEITRSFDDLNRWLEGETASAGVDASDREGAVALLGERWLEAADSHGPEIEALTQWCVMVLRDPQAHPSMAGWSAFHLPERVDYAHLVPLESFERHGIPMQRSHSTRRRDGFHLTDTRMSARQVQDEVHYCLYCHDHVGDFCSRGFPEKKGVPELGLKKNPLGVVLTGCPLEQKISEMHVLKREGRTIGALAMVMADNPMLPATGHRICNDCMKACIYQKQDPVNIPEVETRILTDVLALPWGVEIYDLFTRWNPLRNVQYRMKPFNGRKVLIAGLGPAGFTMAHHLTMEGCAVVGIDGLKIEPLPERLRSGPIRDWSSLVDDLDERILQGFGGVAEYGITVRWDKNFLKLIYLALSRRAGFRAFGGVRFGGTITIDTAWALGFDHVAIATGAGLPRVIPMHNSLARGMRQASDFLMALQLTGAGKHTSLANLQVRLPAVVIGGGLTAVDTATEVQAYYVKQVEKILDRYETMTGLPGAAPELKGLSEEDAGILDEFLAHGRAVRAERERARRAGEAPDFVPLIHAWGGVTLAYRKTLNNAPAYTRNHEELRKAAEEGIYYAEGLDPVRAELDGYGHVHALVFRRADDVDGRFVADAGEVRLPARAVFIAAGSAPNTIYEQEYPGSFVMEGNHFQAHIAGAADLQGVAVAPHCKSPESGPFTSYDQDGRRISFLGDTHPVFHGSVVKAIASAKAAWPQVMEALAARPGSAEDLGGFLGHMEDLFVPRVAAVDRSRPGMVEVWVRAPLAAQRFRPGQFFRLQTFETGSPVVAGTRLQVPLLTVSGAGVAGDRIRLMILQGGTGPRLAGRLEPGTPIVLMGPTGAPTDMPTGKTIAVVAGRWGAAVMLDIGPALRAAGNRVLYVAALASAAELDMQAELEQAADQIVWCTASGVPVVPRRPQDRALQDGDMVHVLEELGRTQSTDPGHIPLGDVDRLMVMGPTRLLKAFQQALTGEFARLFRPDLKTIATVGSPMQCMLKGVCAQCLQWQIDPRTGERTRAVFSCAGQDQPLSWIDLDNLAARQAQNRLSDRLSSDWLDYVLARAN
ncbi:MAG: pyridine nucleotide-disulfide oxidoreductase [Acidiferrobacteraceae bacterium]